MTKERILDEFIKQVKMVEKAPTRQMRQTQLSRLGAVYGFLRDCGFDTELLKRVYQTYGI